MKSINCKMEKTWLITRLLVSMMVSSIHVVEAFHPIHYAPYTLYTGTGITNYILLRNSYIVRTVDSTRTTTHDDTMKRRLQSYTNDDTPMDVVAKMGLSDTGDSSSNSGSFWSVTDDWNRLSQSDNINYNYGNNDDNDLGGEIVVLNSIDQVTLAALRMQNFGMSSTSSTIPPLTEEEIWIQNSIQQIMVIDPENDDRSDDVTINNMNTKEMEHIDITSTTLNTEQFLDDMGKEIAMLVRCNENNDMSLMTTTSLFMDECEILDDSEFAASITTDRQGKSSYERVELHNGTPIWMKDGEFVFIDEQSCIGCMQCASAAPGSFQMLDQGRARTFCQRNSPDVISAVASCPVDCMHYVSYDELKELEIARDIGVADDHRHFGHSSVRGYIPPTPLHISRRDSDANHKSSFYHFIQDKCSKSTNCPKRGCYDCPKFALGKNPYFKEKLTESTHVRAEYFKDTGTADAYRKTADL